MSKRIILRLSIYIALTLFNGNCLNPSAEQYRFWKTYDALQTSIQKSAPSPVLIRALYGGFPEENENLLKKDEFGSYEISLGAKTNSQSQWEVEWNPEPGKSFPYESKTTYTPISWGEKSLYQVERKLKSNWSGFYPSDFFNWLSGFQTILIDSKAFDKLSASSNNLQFLCETFICERKQNEVFTTFSITFSENTKSKFPGFYKKTGGALEKTKLDITILNLENPKEIIKIVNIDKTLIFQFPTESFSKFFKEPSNIEIISQIEINAYGVRVLIERLVYRLSLQKKDSTEILKGRFVSVKSQEITGRFLYFIPTGVIDFFIPGNLNEYLKDALTLLVYGTQGKGGNHFQASYQKTKSGQLNSIQSYAEIQRKRFSLFGANNSEEDKGNFMFFSAWEEAMIKDLKPRD